MYAALSFVQIQRTLFSQNFPSTKFRDFRDFEKITKLNTREI